MTDNLPTLKERRLHEKVVSYIYQSLSLQRSGRHIENITISNKKGDQDYYKFDKDGKILAPFMFLYKIDLPHIFQGRISDLNPDSISDAMHEANLKYEVGE